MRWIHSLWLAFAMYSRIPAPKSQWSEENQRYMLAMFPAVGAAEGALFFAAAAAMVWLRLPPSLVCAVLTALPVLVTGGIHMDGYLDTLDALGSWRDRGEKLRILKDPHVGAAAATGCGLYFLLYAGGAGGLLERWDPRLLACVCMGYVLSRSLSGYGVITIRRAREDGLAHEFAAHAGVKASRLILAGFFLISSLGMCLAGGKSGAAAVLAAVLVFLWFRRMSVRVFGGITGDLAGFFLQICELAVLYTVVLVR